MFKVEGLPDGWAVKEVHIDPDQYNKYIDDAGCLYWEAKIKMEKIQPRRIVLEETGEEMTYPINGYMYGYIDGAGFVKYKIFREVKETDIPLNNDETSLKLTKKDMFYLIEHIKLGGQLNPKIAEFIKENS